MVNFKIGTVVLPIKQKGATFWHLTPLLRSSESGGDNVRIADKIVDYALFFSRQPSFPLSLCHQPITINCLGQLPSKLVRQRLGSIALLLRKEKLIANAANREKIANLDPSDVLKAPEPGELPACEMVRVELDPFARLFECPLSAQVREKSAVRLGLKFAGAVCAMLLAGAATTVRAEEPQEPLQVPPQESKPSCFLLTRRIELAEIFSQISSPVLSMSTSVLVTDALQRFPHEQL